MNRRNFLRWATFACSWGVLPARLLGRALSASDSLTFYVAGVRFHRIRKAPTQGEPVVIEARQHDGEHCYAVCTSSGEQMGWVPRALVPLVSDRQIGRSYLAFADRHAIPWKRYKVTLVQGAHFDEKAFATL